MHVERGVRGKIQGFLHLSKIYKPDLFWGEKLELKDLYEHKYL